MAAAPGNQYAAKARIWQAAIKRALAEKSRLEQKEALDDLALVLVAKAMDGDLGALKELGDRLDGKPAQALDVGGQSDNPILTEVVRRIVKPDH